MASQTNLKDLLTLLQTIRGEVNNTSKDIENLDRVIARVNQKAINVASSKNITQQEAFEQTTIGIKSTPSGNMSFGGTFLSKELSKQLQLMIQALNALPRELSAVAIETVQKRQGFSREQRKIESNIYTKSVLKPLDVYEESARISKNLYKAEQASAEYGENLVAAAKAAAVLDAETRKAAAMATRAAQERRDKLVAQAIEVKDKNPGLSEAIIKSLKREAEQELAAKTAPAAAAPAVATPAAAPEPPTKLLNTLKKKLAAEKADQIALKKQVDTWMEEASNVEAVDRNAYFKGLTNPVPPKNQPAPILGPYDAKILTETQQASLYPWVDEEIDKAKKAIAANKTNAFTANTTVPYNYSPKPATETPADTTKRIDKEMEAALKEIKSNVNGSKQVSSNLQKAFYNVQPTISDVLEFANPELVNQYKALNADSDRIRENLYGDSPKKREPYPVRSFNSPPASSYGVYNPTLTRSDFPHYKRPGGFWQDVGRPLTWDDAIAGRNIDAAMQIHPTLLSTQQQQSANAFYEQQMASMPTATQDTFYGQKAQKPAPEIGSQVFEFSSQEMQKRYNDILAEELARKNPSASGPESLRTKEPANVEFNLPDQIIFNKQFINSLKKRNVTQEEINKILDLMARNLEAAGVATTSQGTATLKEIKGGVLSIDYSGQKELSRGKASGNLLYYKGQTYRNPLELNQVLKDEKLAEKRANLAEAFDKTLGETGVMENYNRDKLSKLGYTTSDVTTLKAIDEELTKITVSKKLDNGLVQTKQLKLYQDELLTLEEYSKKLTEVQQKEHNEKLVEYTNNLTSSSGTPIGQNVFSRAAKIGFNPEDLKSINTEGSTGIQKFNFQIKDGSGVVKNASFVLDRFGAVIQDTQRRFRGFSSTIATDILKVAQWSIAVGAIYTPLYKLQQLVTLAIENQTKLATVMITLGNATQSTAEVFKVIAQAADASGESINGVIEGYADAYRATGDIADANERFATTNKFLSDALILSKLSTLSQTEAIETLSAALKQANVPLDQGRGLLDKMVRATKVANVDLATLATGYAVLGDAADSAGIKQEELIGIVATVAETGLASGKEAANTAAAIVAGFQSDKGIKAIQAMGVATEDVNGKRPFLEIASDLAELSKQGIITSEQMGKLSLEIGGGTRRGKVVNTFLDNFSRVSEVNNKISNASGDAQEALGKQLETVATATTRLGNAFQKLAQTIGTKGGILEVTTTLTNGLTGLVDVLNDVAGLLGNAGPFLLVGSIINGYMSNPNNKLKVSGSVSSALFGSKAENGEISNGLLGYNEKMGIGTSLALQGKSKSVNQAAGMSMAILPAVSNIISGNNANALADVVGAAAGSFAGPVGSMVGISIAEAFVNAVMSNKVTFEDFFAPMVSPKDMTTPPKLPNFSNLTPDEITVKKAELEKAAVEKVGSAGSTTGINIPQLNTFMGNIYSWFATSVLQGKLNANKKINSDFRAGASEQNVNINQSNTTFELLKQFFPDSELVKQMEALQKTIEENNRKAEETLALKEREDAKKAEILGNIGGQDVVNSYTKEIKNLLLKQRIGGAISSSDYKTSNEKTGTASTVALQLTGALGQQLVDSTAEDQINSLSDAYKYFYNLVVSSSDDLQSAITTILNDFTSGTITDAQDALKALADILKEVKAAAASKIKIPTVVDLDKYTKEQAQQIKDRAYSNQKSDFDAYVRDKMLTPEQRDTALAGMESFFTKVQGEYTLTPNLDPNQIKKAIEDLNQEGTLPKLDVQLDVTQWDITKGQLPKMEELYAQKVKEYDAAFGKLGWKENKEDIFVQLADKTLLYQHKDSRVIAEVLKDILDVEKKQLDGIYNLPENGSFFIPLQARQISPTNTPMNIPPENPTAAMVQGSQFTNPNKEPIPVKLSMEDVVPADKLRNSKDWAMSNPNDPIQQAKDFMKMMNPSILSNPNDPIEKAKNYMKMMNPGESGGSTRITSPITQFNPNNINLNNKIELKMEATANVYLDAIKIGMAIFPFLKSQLTNQLVDFSGTTSSTTLRVIP